MQDPISDMLCRIRNGQQAKHKHVEMRSSNLKEQIASVLKDEGYILDYKVESHDNNVKTLVIDLKYYQGNPVIDRLKRISKPGLRVYKSPKDIKPVAGFGVVILSTSKGVMTHLSAKENGVGGEVLCEVA